jgi:hypothetical protein
MSKEDGGIAIQDGAARAEIARRPAAQIGSQSAGDGRPYETFAVFIEQTNSRGIGSGEAEGGINESLEEMRWSLGQRGNQVEGGSIFRASIVPAGFAGRKLMGHDDGLQIARNLGGRLI